ncbi:MAG TPA: RsmE family RNA methyltransferase [Ferruginibacter sp.]|jgi:16S rRNA (uracil1498-N3)-methyltransferase|nr:RsmE family RNA methyltransferase [Ferruginibacter sp.]
MALPFFYKENLVASDVNIVLDEDTSKHVVQVLRMKIGEQLQLTNGEGALFTAEINDNNRKKCTVKILSTNNEQRTANNITIAISLVKNNTRFEWFLEKATEIGVTEIIPLFCSRTEKTSFKFERMKNILVSAMLQSQQCWLPVMHEPVQFDKLWRSFETSPKLDGYKQKFIAHCMDDEKRNLSDLVNGSLDSKIILIGPEGDFTNDEIEQALQHHFIAVSLGETRLRTETAGMVAAVLLRNGE